jgi:hypothetical protein
MTLVEALITILLLSTVLGVVANICSEYAGVVKYSTLKDRTLLGAEGAINFVKNELQEAILIEAPVISATPVTEPGSPSFVLRFRKVESTNEDRLPSALPDPLPASWDPYDSSYVIRVKYYVYDDVLVRQITYSDNSSTAQAMARNLAGFSVQNLGNNSIGVRASFQEEHILKNLTTRMRLRNGL